MNTAATTNECCNEQFLSIKSGFYNEHRCYNKRMLQRTVFINKIRTLQRTQMLQRTVFINKIRILQESKGILFIMETSIIVFNRQRLFMLFKFTRTVYNSQINLFYFIFTPIFFILCYIFPV